MPFSRFFYLLFHIFVTRSMQQYHLHLKGYVGGADFNTESVLATLKANPDAVVSVLVDSTGGQLATALSISSAFHRHGKVHVHFSGMNASAATIASLGAQRISMDASALYLVHKCSMAVFEWASMNADQLQEYIDGLSKQKANMDKLDSNVAAMYAARCRKPQEELLELMKTGGWLTAREAKEWGFVDEVTDYEEDIKPLMTEEMATALATACIPIPAIPYAREQREHNGETLFARFISALTSFFRNMPEGKAEVKAEEKAEGQVEDPTTISNNTTQHKPMKKMPNLEAVLKVEGFEANAEGGVVLTEEQLQSIEDHITSQGTRLSTQETNISEQATTIQERDTTIFRLEGEVKTLKDEVTELKKVPAEESPSVVNAKTGEKESGVHSDYLTNLSNAKELYDFVS